MSLAAIFPERSKNSGSTPQCIPLTVNNTGACDKNSLNFIKRQIFSKKNSVLYGAFWSISANREFFGQKCISLQKNVGPGCLLGSFFRPVGKWSAEWSILPEKTIRYGRFCLP